MVSYAISRPWPLPMPAILLSTFALRRLLPHACAIAACMKPGNRGRWVAREEGVSGA